MSYEKVKQAKWIAIGTKQTRKAIEQGKTEEVYVAVDAKPHITDLIISLCKQHGVAVVRVDSMKELGKACGIEVSAATAAILSD
ncbi:50S ribosomal protein L7ae-like protein [Thermoflavimicrobium daqui]|jgi:large subunit ribosomal protein L7A|uniref:50S ribosomal protein L7ae-like protein n=1 Tax=Thermoflavimicrobium daqui TaxID=2137476 RepID=A0A364K330_9BACL|nr:50S ribosomal protein L7ae-like protein [Thermoflavimicrobium daqui]RAL23242.1 50S ribosomal protein L7ae-like protein [Thermoflavimicrobium daqui]